MEGSDFHAGKYADPPTLTPCIGVAIWRAELRGLCYVRRMPGEPPAPRNAPRQWSEQSAAEMFVSAVFLRRNVDESVPLGQRLWRLGLLGLVVGTMADSFHVWTGTAEYIGVPLIPLLKVGWWVPLEFTAAGITIGLLQPVCDTIIRKLFPKHHQRTHQRLSPARLALGLIGLMALWFGSGLLTVFQWPNELITAILAIGCGGLWVLCDRRLADFITAPLTASIGVCVEWLITTTGHYRYLHTAVHSLHIDSLPVPIWLPFLYIAASIGVGNLGRFYAFGPDGATDTHVSPATPALST